VVIDTSFGTLLDELISLFFDIVGLTHNKFRDSKVEGVLDYNWILLARSNKFRKDLRGCENNRFFIVQVSF